jgi:predicted helicase
MGMPDKESLRSIKTFPSLVKYLRDELDWPIESDNFDELTFEYAPEELGLDAQTAVKIKEVKQLRPLVTNQPWGIFFVNFEPKRLPIVVLRRILRSLVLKTRQSANKAQQAAWKLHDLLFISSYGESEHRDITFAHFSEEPEIADLPTLRVLGWDDEDTALHLEHTDRELREKLRWPANTKDLDAWRQHWSAAFALRHREVISTSKELAQRLADLALKIRKRANAVLRVESETGPLRKLCAAFRETLIHDLTEDDFADMYAQTISYGLLTARVSRPAGLVAENLRDMVPVTNPFLKDLLEAFLTVGGRKGKIDFDELGVSEVVQLLRDADMEAVLRDFGDRNPEEDPAIHFYVLFLKEYDPEKRMKRGVFYTPRPVVSFIVRSVDEILRSEFGLEDGLASSVTWGEMAKRHETINIPKAVSPDLPFVNILDPATGTGTFLVEVIDIIHKTMLSKWRKAGHMALEYQNLWNEYVPKHLLPRLYGFELMMAPYAIAHMKIGLKLNETGYRFGSDERARIYLTNSLEPPSDDKKQREFEEWAPALAHEAQAVNAIKRHQHFTVVVGNPPYASISSNMTPWIRDQVNTYLMIEGTKLEEKSKRNHLQNDYIKFIRIADIACQQSPFAVFAYVTSNSYLDGRTLRGLRWNLLHRYRLAILNLYGDSKKRDASPDDENVFDITEGVSIVVGSHRPQAHLPSIQYAELQGKREYKYRELLQIPSAIDFHAIPAAAPHYLFKEVDAPIRDEFIALGPSIDQLYHLSGAGLKTNRDEFATGEDRKALLERMNQFADKSISDEELRKRYSLKDNYAWKLPKARADFRSRTVSERKVVSLLYRPFDTRFVYYDKAVVFNPRFQIMNHMLHGGNLALVSIGQNESLVFTHAFVSRHPVEIKMGTHYGASVVFPTYLYAAPGELMEGEGSGRSNLTSAAGSLIDIARSSNTSNLSPQLVIVHYVYAILYSQAYRDRYAEALMMDFPRVPLLGNVELFDELARLGNELVALHLLESPKLDTPIATYTGPAKPEVEKISFDGNTVWLDKAQTHGFRGVCDAVWNFHIGGYQVCEKWLKDRKGRTISKDDIAHYKKIVVALSETIRLMKEIDEVIEKHGGWPDAFKPFEN